MDREMFMTLVWPTLAKSIEDKGFEPSLISNETARDGAYILLSPGHAWPQSEKPFRDIVIDLLTRLHIPFEDRSDGLYRLIFVNFDKLRSQDIKND